LGTKETVLQFISEKGQLHCWVEAGLERSDMYAKKRGQVGIAGERGS
jgi:hypothetical protein